MIKKLILPILMLLTLQACFYDNREDLTPEPDGGTLDPPGCETDSISYSAFVQPIIQSNCIGCHSGNNARAGVRLDLHAFVRGAAVSGQLVGVLNGDGGFSVMPPAGKLDDCTISKITSWVDDGAPEN